MKLNKIYIDYAKFGEMLKDMYSLLVSDKYVPTTIIGIANGGLNISKPLSNWFGCKHIEVSIKFYKNGKLKKSGIPYDSTIPRIPKSKKMLLVDDILDSGSTINYFMEKTGLVRQKDFRIATLHWNPKGKFGFWPDYYVDKKEDGNWFVYPWEAEFTEIL
jgi:hypoxanthine phosphoribosyltransferase